MQPIQAMQIRKLLCPKTKWVPDKDATHCYTCKLQFKPIYRWKHHCRFCGNIFCGKCSQNVLMGKDIDYHEEKRLRQCENCYKRNCQILKISSDQKATSKVQTQTYEETLTRKQALSDSDDDQHIVQIQEDLLPQSNQQIQIDTNELRTKLILSSKEILINVAKGLCQKFQIDQKAWLQRLHDLAFKSISEFKIQTFILENSIDVVKQIKIKSILTEKDVIASAIVKGGVIQKNPQNKSMETHFAKPRVLIIRGSIDIDSLIQRTQIKFQQKIKNEKSIMKNFLDKVTKLNPTLIFVQQNVSAFAMEYLQQNKIIILSKMKVQELDLIAKITKTEKQIKKIWKIQRYRPTSIIGTCDKIYFKAIKQGQMFLLIQGEIGMRSIIIGDNSSEIIGKLQRIIQIMLKLAWQLRLERDILVKQKIFKKLLPKESYNLILDEFNYDLYANCQSFIVNQDIPFTRIVYKQTRLQQASKPYLQYGSKFAKNIFYQFCHRERIAYEKKRMYGSMDISLGMYILKLVTSNSEICRFCKRQHAERYYFNNYSILVTVDRPAQKSIITVQEDDEEQEELQKTESKKKSNHSTYSDVLKYFSKIKQRVQIKLCAICYCCNELLGQQKIKIGKQFLSNSLYYYLLRLSTSERKRAVTEPKFPEWKDRRKNSLGCTPMNHQNICRAFECGGYFIKFFIEKYETSQVNSIDLNSQVMKKLINHNDQSRIKEWYKEIKQQKQMWIDNMLNFLQKSPFWVANATMSMGIMNLSTKGATNHAYFIMLVSICRKMSDQFQNCSKDTDKFFQVQVHDWTIFMRKMYKIDNILKYAVYIANQINDSIKKQKIEELKQISEESYSEVILSQPYESPDDFRVGSKPDEFRVGSKPVSSFMDIESPKKQFSKSISQSHILRKNSGAQFQGEMTKVIKNIRNKRFTKHQGIYMHFPGAYVTDPVSILACSLNSKEFNDILTQANYSSTIVLKINFHTDVQTEWKLKQDVQKLYKDIFKEDAGKVQTYQIIAYYHKQFQELRINSGIDPQLYLRSLCGCQNWDSSGGKSNSTFYKSHNQVLVIKIINEKQFVQFQKFAKAYLRYMNQKRTSNQGSLLAKIYGIYQSNIKGKTFKYVVMQNIFLGISGKLNVYDLKGSQVNRLVIPQNQKSITGLDTNFVIDKDGKPYILEGPVYDQIIKMLEDDANFLKEQGVIDYSLLVIESGVTLRLGIIDFMRPYHLLQKIENIYKEIKSGKEPTVIAPCAYADRFINSMRKYFAKVSQ